MNEYQLDRLAFAAQLVLAVSRHIGRDRHNPCLMFYSVDNPEGIGEPVKVCGCQWPRWEVRQPK